ncbi:MAG: CoA transferase [Sphingomonadales bacterium]|nr:MAG: CoA transferase [Sphingomonadales bacterium]
MSKPGPLSGVVVLDMTAGLAGPYATFLLAGMGARVIKIERPLVPGQELPGRGSPPFIGRDGISMMRKHSDDVSLFALQRLRGIESITLDLKKPGGQKVFDDLVARSDILFENLSRGTAARIGAGYDHAISINPALVYTSISGTGQDDLSGSGRTIDTVVQALSGLMMTSGNEGEPPMRNGLPLADLITPLYAVIGTLAALTEARETGRGQHVDVSMLGSITTLLANDHFAELTHFGFPTRTGPTVPRIAPLGVYEAADGWVALCTVTDARFHQMAEVMGRPDLITDERFAKRPQRMRNAKAIDAIVTEWAKTKTASEVAELLDAVGIPAAPVRSPTEALQDPRGIARGDVVQLEHPVHGATHPVFGPGIPVKFGARTYPKNARMPEYGEHNASVYQDLLGYDDAALDALKAAEAI